MADPTEEALPAVKEAIGFSFGLSKLLALARKQSVQLEEATRESLIRTSAKSATIEANPAATVEAKSAIAVKATSSAAQAAKPAVAVDTKQDAAVESNPGVGAEAEQAAAGEAKHAAAAEAEPVVAIEAKPTAAGEANPVSAEEAKPPIAAEAESAAPKEAKPHVGVEAKTAAADEARPVVASEAKAAVASLPTPTAAEVKPERRESIGSNTLVKVPSMKPEGPTEIQPVQEPAESSKTRKKGPKSNIPKVREAVQEGSAEQIKVLQARAVTSGPGASLRRDLSYDAYAKNNFRTQLSCRRSRSIEDTIKFSQKRISEPLLKSVHQHDKHDAVAVFAHLMAYMGDLSGTKTETEHLLQVMSGGLRKPVLRDEIFCQICKQTTENPDRVSNAKGWQAMALSCGLFAPSPNFLPVLEAHLEQVVHGTVAKGKDKGKSSEQVAGPAHFATYSLFRLRKLISVGQRHLLPLPEEIAAVEKMGNISATVFLPDSTSKSLPVDPMITTEEVVIKIVQFLGLSEPKYFCLWEVDPEQVEKSLGKREYVAEVQSRWAASCIPQSVNDFQSPIGKRLMNCWRRANKKIATVSDLGDSVLDLLFVMTSKGDHKPKLLFKRNLFLSTQDLGVGINIKNRELALDFSQAVHDVLRGAYPLSKHDLMVLAALQLRAELGSNLPKNATGMQIIKYLPQYIEGEEEMLKGGIISIASGLPEDSSPASRRIDYLDYLKTRYLLAEASWYSARQTEDEALPGSLLVAINASGVYFLRPDTMEELMHLKYTEICSWAYSYTAFSIVTGNVNRNQELRLVTLQGKDMGQIMELFINRLF